MLVVRSKPYIPFGSATSAGVIAVTPLYSKGAPPGPKPRQPVVAPPAERDEPPPVPVEVPRRSEPKPAPPDQDVFKEAKPAPGNTPRKRSDRPGAASPRATPATGEEPGGGTLPSASGPPGSPTGTLRGDPDGGLSALQFTNQWYVARVRDIVYSNWGDPFLAQPRPQTPMVAVVRFRIQRSGGVTDVTLDKSGGNAGWDRAALRAVENAKLPPLPPDYAGASVIVHYEFSLDSTR